MGEVAGTVIYHARHSSCLNMGTLLFEELESKLNGGKVAKSGMLFGVLVDWLID